MSWKRICRLAGGGSGADRIANMHQGKFRQFQVEEPARPGQREQPTLQHTQDTPAGCVLCGAGGCDSCGDSWTTAWAAGTASPTGAPGERDTAGARRVGEPNWTDAVVHVATTSTATDGATRAGASQDGDGAATNATAAADAVGGDATAAVDADWRLSGLFAALVEGCWAWHNLHDREPCQVQRYRPPRLGRAVGNVKPRVGPAAKCPAFEYHSWCVGSPQ